MKNKIKKQLEKLTNVRYVSVWLVLFADLVIALISTLLAIFSVRLFAHVEIPFGMLCQMVIVAFLCSLVVFLYFKTYRKAIRHTTISDLGLLSMACLVKSVAAYLILTSTYAPYREVHPVMIGIADLFFSIVFLSVERIFLVYIFDSLRRQLRLNQESALKKILIYGTSDKSVAIVTRLQNSPHYDVKGFIEYGSSRNGMMIGNHKIFHFASYEDFADIKSQVDLDGILFSTAADASVEQKRLVDYALSEDVSIFFAPGIDESKDGNLTHQAIRQISIEDLLGREEIRINLSQIRSQMKDKVVLVTGAAGSIGSELCRQLSSFGVKQLVMFDNAETPMHNLRLEFDEKFPDVKYVPVIGDVRQEPRLDYVFRKFHPQIVFHAAAYKHVPLMEENPCEAVLVNVIGSRNVAEKCIEYNAEKMVMISTDKAVNPTNIMGCTKRLAEIYVQSLGAAVEKGDVKGETKFVTTRFGNVLGSNGSVIPRFKAQIAEGGPLTVTHPDINRFFMTIPEACRLVMEAASMNVGNRIFIFDMGESVKIVDLAKRMIELAGFRPGEDIKIEFTGLRPGEKLYEEVLANAENTDPTSHDRIRIARTRDYSFEDARSCVGRLEDLSRSVNIPDMVKLMKEIVPEYISNNSQFCIYDKK